jgi:hypothetical protein
MRAVGSGNGGCADEFREPTEERRMTMETIKTKWNNRAVVAWSGNPHDDGCLLHIDGKDIEGLFGIDGYYADDESPGVAARPLFGCDGMPKGISIWEGEINDQGENPNETGFIVTGAYRRPSLEEISKIVEGKSPWARFLSEDIFSELQDRLTLSSFVRKGLDVEQAGLAVVAARDVVEQMESTFIVRL